MTSELMTVSDICSRVPGARGGRRLHPATVTRWIISGCPNRAGTRVRLPATRCGGRWLVNPAHLAEFFLALAATDAPPTVPPITPKRSEAQQRNASEAAARELERRGA